MTTKTFSFLISLILFIGIMSSCKKDNNTETPIIPDEPSTTYSIPPIDEYMPERLLHLFDSLGVLHRGDEPPTIAGDFMTESLYLLIVDKVPESAYTDLPILMQSARYFEFKEQENDTLHLSFYNPKGNPDDLYAYFLEKSDTDSTYFRIKDNTDFFTNDLIAPSYFRSDRFKAEDFRRAYIIGNSNYFTIYYYELRDISNQSLPLNAVLISGKMSTDAEGDPIIEDFWCGIETMKYANESPNINQIIQFGYLPYPGDILISNSPNALIPGNYNK